MSTQRLGRRPDKTVNPPRLRLVHTTAYGGSIIIAAAVCDWCQHNDRRIKPSDTRGCLMCREVYDEAQRLNADSFFCDLCKQVRLGTDSLAPGVLRDWLIERGYDTLAADVDLFAPGG